MFIRRDARAPPLTQPYQGPYKVLKSGEKFFEIEVNNKSDRISIDRLKRAYVESEENNNNSTKRDSLTNDSTADTVSQQSNSELNTESRTENYRPEDFPPLPQPLFPKKQGRPTRQQVVKKAAISRTVEQPPVTTRTRSRRIIRPPDRL